MFIEGHVTYRDAKIINNDYGHPVLNTIVNYQFEPYGGNGIIRLMQFDELNKEISFQSYSPWVQKKMDILDNKIENDGILNDDEKKLFPFDKLNITQDPSDNITFEFDFTERFKNLDKVEPINRENLDKEISLSNNYDLSQYQDGNEKDNFINALSNAKNIQKDLAEEDSLITQEIVDQACKKLKETRLLLIPITNKTALKIAVDLANAITDEDLANVVSAVADEFKVARDEANAVYNDATASQEQVNNAFDRLANAMHMLDFKQGDKTALKAFIDKVSGLEAAKYTEATWTVFETELNEAVAVYEDLNAMQEEVNTAYSELVTAFLNLRLIPDKSLLEDLINQAEGLDSANYTKASYAVVENALLTAKAVYENPNATQEEVNSAKDVLEKAINSLEANTTTSVDNTASTPIDNTVKTPVNNGDTTASVKTGDQALVETLVGITLLSVAGFAILRKKEKD